MIESDFNQIYDANLKSDFYSSNYIELFDFDQKNAETQRKESKSIKNPINFTIFDGFCSFQWNLTIFDLLNYIIIGFNQKISKF